jgi:hypothetical protein
MMPYITNAPRTITEAELGSNVTAPVEAPRIENRTPDGYRLARKTDGEVVLQGAYRWQQGLNGGIEWRDNKTVKHGQDEGSEE